VRRRLCLPQMNSFVVIDQHTRECVATIVGRRITFQDIIDRPFHLIESFGEKLRDEPLN